MGSTLVVKLQRRPSTRAAYVSAAEPDTGAAGIRRTTCVGTRVRWPTFTDTGRGFCAKTAAAIP